MGLELAAATISLLAQEKRFNNTNSADTPMRSRVQVAKGADTSGLNIHSNHASKRKTLHSPPCGTYFIILQFIFLVSLYCVVFLGKGLDCLHTPTDTASPLRRNMADNIQDDADASTIFVISMQGTPGVHKKNEGRLDSFKEKWRKVCGTTSTNIVHCPGVVDKRRGYGLTTSWLLCLVKAKEYDLDVTVIFEDDARLFDRSTSFCDVSKRREEYWSTIPSDAFIAFLGGHSWEYVDDIKTRDDTEQQYQELSFSYGTYGFAIPRSSFPQLLDTIKDDIVEGFKDENNVHQHHNYLSPEKSWYRAAKRAKKKVYAANPLVVWHEGGFSNTWQKIRGSITGEEENSVGGVRGVKG